MIEIETGIPMPRPSLGRSPDQRIKWDEMRVGESIWVPLDFDSPGVPEEPEKLQKRMTARHQAVTKKNMGAARYTAKIARKDPNNETSPLGVRVWRLALTPTTVPTPRPPLNRR